MFLSALTMIYARKFLGKGSTVLQGTSIQEISGTRKSLRIEGKKREKPKKKEKEKMKGKRKKSKKKKRYYPNTMYCTFKTYDSLQIGWHRYRILPLVQQAPPHS